MMIKINKIKKKFVYINKKSAHGKKNKKTIIYQKLSSDFFSGIFPGICMSVSKF